MLNTANPSAITVITELPIRATDPVAITVVGDYLYVQDSDYYGGGLEILSVVEPSAYSFVNYLSGEGISPIDGALGVVLMSAGGPLKLYSLAEPSRPNEIGAFNSTCLGYTDFGFTDVVVAGATMYVTQDCSASATAAAAQEGAASVYSLLVLDISDPAQIEQVGELPNIRAPLAIEQDVVYAGNQIVAVAEASRPQLVGDLPIEFERFIVINSIAVRDSIAYISEFNDGLFLLDVEQPETPELLESSDLEGRCVSNLDLSSAAILMAVSCGGQKGDLWLAEFFPHRINIPVLVR